MRSEDWRAHRVDDGIMHVYVAISCPRSCPGSKPHGYLHKACIPDDLDMRARRYRVERRLELPHLVGGKTFLNRTFPHERHAAAGMVYRHD